MFKNKENEDLKQESEALSESGMNQLLTAAQQKTLISEVARYPQYRPTGQQTQKLLPSKSVCNWAANQVWGCFSFSLTS